MNSLQPLKKYWLASLILHGAALLFFLFFGTRAPVAPPPTTQVTMIRLSRSSGSPQAPFLQKPAAAPKPAPTVPNPPSKTPTPPIPAAKPAPVKVEKPIGPAKPTKPATTATSQKTVHLDKQKAPAPQPSTPPPPSQAAPPKPAAPTPDEQKLAEALGQVEQDLAKRQAQAENPANASPGTSSSGQPGFGDPGGQVGATDPGFAQYVGAVKARIINKWIRTNSGPDEGQPLRTRVQVRIDAGGQVIGKAVVKGSGNESFDLSALRAIEQASPLPPPPEAIRGEALSEGFVVDFSSRMLGKR